MSTTTLRPFTTAHDPVVTSSLAYNEVHCPASAPTDTGPISRVKRHYVPIEGINEDSIGHTDCHLHNGGYIYFTVGHPNGTIAATNELQHALFFVDSPWMLSYWNTLRNSFLNDPTEDRYGDPEYEYCKSNCHRDVIPKVQYWDHPVVLKHMEDPEPLRNGWHGSRCQYSHVRGITKKNVKLANMAHSIYGAQVPEDILDFMEAEIRKTYPKLEIMLICPLTVGFLPCISHCWDHRSAHQVGALFGFLHQRGRWRGYTLWAALKGRRQRATGSWCSATGLWSSRLSFIAADDL